MFAVECTSPSGRVYSKSFTESTQDEKNFVIKHASSNVTLVYFSLKAFCDLRELPSKIKITIKENDADSKETEQVFFTDEIRRCASIETHSNWMQEVDQTCWCEFARDLNAKNSSPFYIPLVTTTHDARLFVDQRDTDFLIMLSIGKALETKHTHLTEHWQIVRECKKLTGISRKLALNALYGQHEHKETKQAKEHDWHSILQSQKQSLRKKILLQIAVEVAKKNYDGCVETWLSGVKTI